MVTEQLNAMAANGHETALVSVSTDDLASSPLYGLRSAVNVMTGKGYSPLEKIQSFKPDVVHVHNLFPNISTNWLTKWDGPIVATLHNFRPVCASGTLFRDSAGCTLCPDHGSHHAVMHACYKESRLATLPLAIRNRGGVDADRVLARSNKLIVLSDRAKTMYEHAGLRSEKVSVLPNFVSSEGFKPETQPGAHWVYVGRLTEEKGIMRLLQNWPADKNLYIYGDGPLRAAVVDRTTKRIKYKGKVIREEIPGVLAAARGLVFPSLWAEGAVPLTYVEALAAGRPVVAYQGNGAADDIYLSGAGQVFTDWSELPASLDTVEANLRENCARARDRYEFEFTTEKWMDRIIDLYTTTMRES